MDGKIFRRTPAIHLLEFLTALLFTAFFGLPVDAYAAEITYIGKEDNLQDMPFWFSDTPSKSAFFPGTTAAPLPSGNSVTVNYNPAARGTTNPKWVIGGLSERENTSDNKVILQKMAGDALVHGGYTASGAALRNVVSVGRGSVVGGVCGGISWSSNVIGNTVTISGGSAKYGACGGFSLNGDVVNNVVVLNSGLVETRVYGGQVEEIGNAAGNSVVIGGGSVIGDVVGGVSASGDVSGNKITISGGSVEGAVLGGRSEKGKTTGGIVAISGGSVDVVVGGLCSGGDSVDNIVTISRGVVIGGIYGGLCKGGNASGNTIIISGGVFGRLHKGGNTSGNTIGGGPVKAIVMGGNSSGGDAVNNTVTISGRPNLAETFIQGGYSETYSKDDFSGNTLNLKNKGILAARVSDFEYYKFDLPKDMAAGAVMLSVAETVNLKGTTVEILLPSDTKLKKSDKIALIHSTKGISDSPKNKSRQVKHGGLLYEFSIYTDSNNLWAEVTEISKVTK